MIKKEGQLLEINCFSLSLEKSMMGNALMDYDCRIEKMTSPKLSFIEAGKWDFSKHRRQCWISSPILGLFSSVIWNARTNINYWLMCKNIYNE